MKQHVIILNGPPGVGKTTTGRLLAAMAASGACVEGDVLRHFTMSKNPDLVRGRLGFDNAASVANNFIDAGYDRVIIDYVFETREHLDYLSGRLETSVPVWKILLWAPLKEALRRNESRGTDGVSEKRVRECWQAMDPVAGDLGTTVDALGAPDDIAAHIHGMVSTRDARE